MPHRLTRCQPPHVGGQRGDPPDADVPVAGEGQQVVVRQFEHDGPYLQPGEQAGHLFGRLSRIRRVQFDVGAVLEGLTDRFHHVRVHPERVTGPTGPQPQTPLGTEGPPRRTGEQHGAFRRVVGRLRSHEAAQLHGLRTVRVRRSETEAEAHVLDGVTRTVDLEFVPGLRVEAFGRFRAREVRADVHRENGAAVAPEHVEVRDVQPGISPGGRRIEVVRHRTHSKHTAPRHAEHRWTGTPSPWSRAAQGWLIPLNQATSPAHVRPGGDGAPVSDHRVHPLGAAPAHRSGRPETHPRTLPNVDDPHPRLCLSVTGSRTRHPGRNRGRRQAGG